MFFISFESKAEGKERHDNNDASYNKKYESKLAVKTGDKMFFFSKCQRLAWFQKK